jgi:hypothetical protein
LQFERRLESRATIRVAECVSSVHIFSWVQVKALAAHLIDIVVADGFRALWLFESTEHECWRKFADESDSRGDGQA